MKRVGLEQSLIAYRLLAIVIIGLLQIQEGPTRYLVIPFLKLGSGNKIKRKAHSDRMLMSYYSFFGKMKGSSLIFLQN